MSAPKEYRIGTITDFLAVPEDRLDECLREFGIMLKMARPAIGLMDEVSDAVTSKGAIRWGLSLPFVWIDDSLGNITLRMGSEPEVTP